MSQVQVAPPVAVRREYGATQLKWGRIVGQVASYALFLLLTFLVALPILWLLSTSLKSRIEYAAHPVTILPSVVHWENYRIAVFDYPFLKHGLNTLYLALSSTLLTVLSSSLGGFGFARHNAPLKSIMFVLVLSMLMVPRMVTIIPNFMLFSRLRLTDTYWPWILWGASGSSYHIFLFRQFFSAVPKDLEDAAEVDGCGRFRIYWQIFMPNSGPAIAVAAIFHFQWVWGDWFTPRIFLSQEKTTLGVLLAGAYKDPQGYPLDTLTVAAIMVYILPMIIVFFFAQKYIIQGIVTTGLKG